MKCDELLSPAHICTAPSIPDHSERLQVRVCVKIGRLQIQGANAITVHPHSSPRTYFIYCVGQELVTINAYKAAMAAAQVPAKPLLGRYKGKSEQSFISRMDDFEVNRPWLNAEESYLHIHSFDARDWPKATLCYLSDGSEEHLGRLVPVVRETAMQRDAFTYDPTYGQYFVCD